MPYYLSPLGNEQQFFNSSGDPLTGAKLFTYLAGSTTKQATYKNQSGATPNANPIVLGSDGRSADPIWLTGGLSYKFVLAPSTDTDPPTSPIWTIDNISGINDTSVSVDQWVTGPAPTYVSATSFTLVGDQTSTFHVGRRLKLTDSGGTDYGVITVSAYTTLTTITVVLDSGSLDSGLSAVSYGLLSASNPSVPGVKINGLDWTHSGTVTMSGKSMYWAKGADIASAATLVLGTDGNMFDVTGATGPITAITVPAGMLFMLQFDSTPTLTHHATNLNLPGGADIIAAAGDRAICFATAANTVHVLGYTKADGKPVVGALTSGTVIATTSGTSHDFTGIPSGVKRIQMSLVDVSTNGGAVMLVQIGDSGGIEASGYLGNSAQFQNAGAVESASFTAGLGLSATGAATIVWSGIVTLDLVDASTNTWAMSFASGWSLTTYLSFGGCSKSLSATLDRIRLTTASGTDAFDAGKANILYEV